MNWEKAIKLIKNNESVTSDEIKFDNKMSLEDIIFFTENNIEVPEEYANYEDNEIDCSDIPEITNKDINSEKLLRV